MLQQHMPSYRHNKVHVCLDAVMESMAASMAAGISVQSQNYLITAALCVLKFFNDEGVTGAGEETRVTLSRDAHKELRGMHLVSELQADGSVGFYLDFCPHASENSGGSGPAPASSAPTYH